MCTSRLIHSDAASFDDGASARFATSPNSTRSAAAASRGRPRPGRGEPGQDRPDPEPLPQLVQHVGAAVGPRLGELQALARGGGHVAGLQQPGQRRDQAADGLLVELVLTAEPVDHLRHRPALGRVPLVVGELQVADFAGLGLPHRGLHVHSSRRLHDSPSYTGSIRLNRVSRRFRSCHQARAADLLLHPARASIRRPRGPGRSRCGRHRDRDSGRRRQPPRMG